MSGLTDLTGRSAVVTGAAAGIGRGIAEALRDAGVRVMLADIDEAAVRTTGDELAMPACTVDVRDAGSVAALAAHAVEVLGGVDIICNNAGIGPAAPIAEMTLADWHWLIDVNLWGVIHGVHAFLPILRANPHGGHIVNTASMSGLAPAAGLGGYSVSKFGVTALTEALAAELAAEGSRVGATLLCPGPVPSRIGDGSKHRPANAGAGSLGDLDLGASGIFGAEGPPWVDPIEVGRIVVGAIRQGNLYAISHPMLGARIAARHRRIEAAFDTPVAENGA